jgi:hypothetical protein
MNRRLYNNRSFVLTAIYRVLVMIYGIQTILFYRLNQGSDPLLIYLYASVGRGSGQDMVVDNQLPPLFTG